MKTANLYVTDIYHIQSSHAFKTPLKPHLYKQVISNSVFLVASPVYPPSPLITFLLCVCVCVCVCVCMCVCVQERNTIRLYLLFLVFRHYCWPCKAVCLPLLVRYSAVGWFSETGLPERLPFVIFRIRSRERLQHHFQADFWVGVYNSGSSSMNWEAVQMPPVMEG